MTFVEVKKALANLKEKSPEVVAAETHFLNTNEVLDKYNKDIAASEARIKQLSTSLSDANESERNSILSEYNAEVNLYKRLVNSIEPLSVAALTASLKLAEVIAKQVEEKHDKLVEAEKKVLDIEKAIAEIPEVQIAAPAYPLEEKAEEEKSEKPEVEKPKKKSKSKSK